jgi:transposase InsO family protein
MTTINETALNDLKRRYETPGDPLYLAAIQTIKDHYKSTLSEEDIRNFLAKSRAYTLFYEFKRPIHNPYYIRRLRQMFQMDLTEVTKIAEHNEGYKYILVVIDCFSRKVWVRLLKNKTAKEVLSNFKNILKETGSVESVVSDRGMEFMNKEMKKFLSDSNIQLKNPYTTTHAPFVERWCEFKIHVKLF